MSVFGAVTAAHLSGSSYIANASLVAALIWFGSNLFWLLSSVWHLTGAGTWRYVALELFALIYFYVQWASHEAQHRRFHFLLMWSYLITMLFYAFQVWVVSFNTHAFGVSARTYTLISNILFELELLLIFGYALLFRYAKRNKAQYLANVEQGFEKAGEAKKNLSKAIRKISSKSDD